MIFTKLEELLGNATMLQKVKTGLQAQLDDVKRMADDEAKERQSLLGRFRVSSTSGIEYKHFRL